MSGKIVMIGSMKGGVSKTVTTFNLAYSLSKLGKKVLAVDFDSQANLSTCLGVENVTAVPVTIGNLMLAQIEEEELPERSEYIQTTRKLVFELWKEVSTCHIEVTYRVNILAVRHSFRTVRCIVRNISLYIQRTELMQQSVAMVPSGSVREGSS